MRELIVVGLGELGQLFAGAALRAGMRVTPVLRGASLAEASREVSAATPLLVAVGEADLDDVLSNVPPSHAHRVILLQNELFPSTFAAHGIEPTVLVPWLLKKTGQPQLVAHPTPVYGKYAELVCELHRVLGIACIELESAAALHQALVEKYAFIVTINALGVLRDRTLGVWLSEDPQRVAALTLEAAALGAALCQAEVDANACVRATHAGMQALAPVPARGRTARARVERAVAHAARLGVPVPELRAVLDAAR